MEPFAESPRAPPPDAIIRLNRRLHAGEISREEHHAKLERLYMAYSRPPRGKPKKLLRPPPRPSRGYARLSEEVYSDARGSLTAARLVALLVQFARGRGSCTAFVDQLADRLGVSPRTIQRARVRAEQELGWIRVEEVRNGRINDANIWHLIGSALPPPNQGKRRRQAARREIHRVTVVSPHEESGKTFSPSPSSSPSKMASDARLRPTSALMRVTTPVSDTGAPKTKTVIGGANAKIVPKTGPP